MKYLFISIVLVVFSCSSSQKKEREEWKDIISPAEINSEEQRFFRTSAGEVGLTWLEKDNGVVMLKYAVLKNTTWTAPKLLVSGNEILANWADFPGIQTNGKHWLAWFLQMNNPHTFAYDVMIMQSSDEGNTWSAPQKLHNDSTRTEHGFVSAVPSINGFQLMWLDGRLATEESPIFTVRSAHVSFEREISNRSILDDNACTCCQTSMLNIGDDTFIAMYRNRTDEEVRDIATVTYTNSGIQNKPQIVYADGWHIAGCPVNGPRSIINGDEIGLVWFTMGTKGVATVKFATSADKGKTYSSPILIDEGNIGRVDILAFDGAYYISYMDDTALGTEIKIAKIQNSKIVDIYSISNVSSSRKTGFPRMALDEKRGGVYVTYTDVGKKQVVLKYLIVGR